MQRQPTRGQNAWQDPSTAQPGFGAYRFGGQPSQQQPTSQPAPQPSQPNMAAYGPSFRRDETVYSPFGNFQNLGAFQQHQDAFVQQFLQGQNQYNQALNSGQQAAPVNLGQAWQQAGENIANGTYQGNPFATGNVQGLMGMFDMYGIQAPAGFQDQLISQIGQQSPPSMYSPTPRPPMTSYPIGPNGEYYPGFGVGPQQQGNGPSASMAPVAPQQTPASDMLVDWGQKRANGSLDVPPQPMPQRPQSGPTGPQGEYYPGGPMTPFVRQPSPARSPISERRIDPTPSSPDLVRRVEEDAARDRRLRQEAEMQERYPWLEPVRRSPGGKVTGWQPNQQRVAEAERAREQKLQDQGYIIGAIKPDGEKVWISPQQQAARQQQAESLRAAAEERVRQSGTGFATPWQQNQQRLQRLEAEAAARNQREQPARQAEKERRERDRQERREAMLRLAQESLQAEAVDRGGGYIRPASPTPRPVGSAYPSPERSQGTPYVPPEPLRAAPGSSGPGWRESGGVRIYNPYTDPTGTGDVGVMGPNHVRPGWKVSPVTGQLIYDPYTDPIATGGGPAYSPSVPEGRTWGPGTPRQTYVPSEPGRRRTPRSPGLVGFG